MKYDFEKAIHFSKKALEIKKDYQPALNMLGHCLIETGDFTEAEIALLNALEDDEIKPYSLNNLGYLNIITERLEEGFLLIEKSLQLKANNGYAYRNRGIYHFKKDQFNLAKKDFEKAKELKPDTLHLDEWMQQLQRKLNETQIPTD